MFYIVNRFFITLFFCANLGMAMQDVQSEIGLETLKAELNTMGWNGEILLVIDMQKEFPAANDKDLQDNIATMIRTAITNNQLIVFLEYGTDDKTLFGLSSIAENYPRTVTLYKHTRSGCREINDFLNNFDKDNYLFHACGVDTSACVYDTVTDLCRCKLGYRVNVLSKCCGSAFVNDHDEAIEMLKEFGKEYQNLQVDDKQEKYEDVSRNNVDHHKKHRTKRSGRCTIF